MAELSKADATELQASEYSWGPGLAPHRGSGGGSVPAPGNGPAGVAGELSAYERLRATRMTDTTNESADESDVWNPDVSESHWDSSPSPSGYVGEEVGWVPGTLRPGVTQPVDRRAVPGMPSVGQHARVRTDRFSSAHEADGYQDGSGAEWRASVPENPVE